MKKHSIEFIGTLLQVLTVRMTVRKLATVSRLQIWLVANLGAGVLAAHVFRIVNPDSV